MKVKRRNTIILVLMVTSQLLLTGFVFQWLSSQYRGERIKLLGDLKTLYITSQNEILDSILLKTYVKPVLADSAAFILTSSSSFNDTLIREAIVNAEKNISQGIRWSDSAMVTVNLSHSMDPAADINIKSSLRKSPSDMLLKSVKLIVAHMEDTSISGNRIVRRFSFDIDTSVFKSTYAAKLTGSGMAFAVGWNCARDSATDISDRKGLIINPSADITMPAALVSGYGNYLLKRILPQVLFGIILVLITAMAFYAAYRSIRYQTALNELRNEFIGNITHELKTPVATLRVALESLGNYNMKSNPRLLDEYLGLASSETRRLEDLINRVLDHTQLEERGNSLELKELDMDRVIEEVVNLMNQRAGNGGRIEYRNVGGKKNVLGDRLYLQGVLMNIVDNGIKYCDKVPHIKIDMKAEDRFTVIEISDNGPGIPEVYQKRIFDKFFRVPSGNVHNVKGYGLGLSFASMIMKLHGGTISVRNLNPGCSFILKLPATG